MANIHNFEHILVKPEGFEEDRIFFGGLRADIKDSILIHKTTLKDKKVNLFVGVTGSGKSTTTNYFIGTPLKRVKTHGKWVIDIDTDSGECPDHYPKIGHRSTAETSISSPYIDKKSGFVFTDSPGVEENRDEKQRILSALAIKFAVQSCESLKSSLVTVNYKHLEGKLTNDFSNFIDYLNNTFGDNLSELASTGNVLFLITKARVENEEGAVVTASVDDILEIIKSSKNDFKRQLRREGLTQADIKAFKKKVWFLELLEENCENIVPINPIKNIGKEEVFSKLEHLDMPIAKNMVQFNSESLNLLTGQSMRVAKYFNRIFSQLKFRKLRIQEINTKIEKVEQKIEGYKSEIDKLSEDIETREGVETEVMDNNKTIREYEEKIRELRGGRDVEVTHLSDKLERIQYLVKEIKRLKNVLYGIPKYNEYSYLHKEVDLFNIKYNKKKHYPKGYKERGWKDYYWTELEANIAIDGKKYSDVKKDCNTSYSGYSTSCSVNANGNNLTVKYKSYGEKEHCKLKIFYKDRELNPEYVSVQNELTSLEHELKMGISPYNTAKEAIRAIKSEISRIEQKHSDQVDNKRKYKAEIKCLNEENDELIEPYGSLGELRTKKAELKAKKSLKEQKIQDAEEKIERYKRTVETLDQEAQRLQNVLSEDLSAYECLKYIFEIVGVEENSEASKFLTFFKELTSDVVSAEEHISEEDIEENYVLVPPPQFN